jgi:hypothetical protein
MIYEYLGKGIEVDLGVGGRQGNWAIDGESWWDQILRRGLGHQGCIVVSCCEKRKWRTVRRRRWLGDLALSRVDPTPFCSNPL